MSDCLTSTEAEAAALLESVKKLDIKDCEFLVFNINAETKTMETIKAMLWEISRRVAEQTGKFPFVIVLEEGETVEAYDEAKMKAAGWVKVEQGIPVPANTD